MPCYKNVSVHFNVTSKLHPECLFYYIMLNSITLLPSMGVIFMATCDLCSLPKGNFLTFQHKEQN